MTTDDELWALAALAGLTGMGPRRLAAVLSEHPPGAAWAAISAGRLRLRGDVATTFPGTQLARLGRVWSEEAGRRSPAELLRRCRALGVEVLPFGSSRYPQRLRDDPEPPLVLFARGDLDLLDAPAAAVVGTRRATPYGLAAADELGGDLAGAGVAVVSGLALGIDAAAHRGALRAAGGPVVGVVASGLDVVYPRRNAALWAEVARRGLLLSEAPPGTLPEPWRFPARNRVIAGLSQVVVVVESPPRGGSMITAEQALVRDRPVMAVPGSIHSPVSVGTNTLLAEGGSPVRAADDVLSRLGWPGRTGSGPTATRAPRRGSAEPSRRPAAVSLEPGDPVEDHLTSSAEHRVLEALGWEPALLDDVARRSGLGLPAVVLALEALVRRGEVVRHGAVLRRQPRPARSPARAVRARSP